VGSIGKKLKRRLADRCSEKKVDYGDMVVCFLHFDVWERLRISSHETYRLMLYLKVDTYNTPYSSNLILILNKLKTSLCMLIIIIKVKKIIASLLQLQ